MRLSVIAALASVAAVSAQQNFTVIVGGNGALTFNPTTLVPATNDLLSSILIVHIIAV